MEMAYGGSGPGAKVVLLKTILLETRETTAANRFVCGQRHRRFGLNTNMYMYREGCNSHQVKFKNGGIAAGSSRLITVARQSCWAAELQPLTLIRHTFAKALGLGR